MGEILWWRERYTAVVLLALGTGVGKDKLEIISVKNITYGLFVSKVKDLCDIKARDYRLFIFCQPMSCLPARNKETLKGRYNIC